jgi:hypothetical protein
MNSIPIKSYGQTSLQPNMKSLAKKTFTIPELMHRDLLPDPNLSLKALTEFSLPSQTTNKSSLLFEFFSKNAPSIISSESDSMTQLRHLPIPESTTV